MDIDERDKLLSKFLNNAGIVFTNIKEIEGMHIPREILLDTEKYKIAKESVPELKQLFSSSYLTCLQNPASDKQKWPLLNLVRQVLLSSGYNLKPKRLSDGYTKDGIKKYKRIFIIEKLNKNINPQIL
tara:strand:- start:1429 stop:1812 length:384 start_codon:yes stop_codon:yes gene_type:complete